MQPRVLAKATVDVGRFSVPFGFIPFVVRVWGELEGGDELPERFYEIGATDDDSAGMRGLDLYVVEMQRPN